MKKPTISTKKVFILTLSLLFGIILALSVIFFVIHLVLQNSTNILRGTESEVTEYILSLTPIGTDIDDVIETIRNHSYLNNWGIRREGGFVHPRPHTVRPLAEGWPVIVGDKSIRADESYWPLGAIGPELLITVLLTIYWAFDEDGKLTEVYVWRRRQ